MKREIEKAIETLVGKCGDKISDRDKELIRRAVETLYGNIIVPKEGETNCWGDLRSLAPAIPRYVGHWNWDSAFHALAILHWDTAFAREQAKILFDAQHENGCLSNVYFPYGGNVTNRSQPPVWYWAYEEIDRMDPDDESLLYAYGVLKKYEGFWVSRRKTNGMFRYDADEGKNPYFVKFESGWDTSPRWDKYLPDVLWPIDLNCYMVLAYRSLAYMAERLGKTEDLAGWKNAEKELTDLINEKLWHKEMGMYCDTVIENGLPTGVQTPASFMPMFIGIASKEQAESLVKFAKDTEKFYPLMPSIAYDAPEYAAPDYFRGPTWLNISYIAVNGLKKYGYDELADGFRDRILDVCANEKNGLFEYYDSRTGEGRGACGYGWTSACIIRFILESYAK